MTMDPLQSRAWHGFMECMQPPDGYRTAAAFGTTFGLGFDALVAATLAMIDITAEELAADPLHGVMAAAKLSDRVRVLVQAGSISGRTGTISPGLASLLDRMVVPVHATQGVFHPKLWVLRYVAEKGDVPDRVRVLVGSRNLTKGSALEIGAVIEGSATGTADSFGRQVASVLQHAMATSHPGCEAVASLPVLLRQTTFSAPSEGADEMRLLWQEPSGAKNHKRFPVASKRTVVLSPFLADGFVRDALERTQELRVISTAEAFSGLSEETLQLLVERAEEQESPAALAFTDGGEKPDEWKFEGLHAKLYLFEGEGSEGALTILGSANATIAGWGASERGNVEAMLALRPGFSLDRFEREFLFDRKSALRGWVREFLPTDRVPKTEEDRERDQLQRVVRAAASERFVMRYTPATEEITLSLDPSAEARTSATDELITIECAPLALAESDGHWQPLSSVRAGTARFAPVKLSEVSSFVVVRARGSSGAADTRMGYARLEIAAALLDARDREAREQLLSTYSIEQVLFALFADGGTMLGSRGAGARSPGLGMTGGFREAVEQLTLERMLKRIAADPGLVREMEILFGRSMNAESRQFLDELRASVDAWAENGL